MPAGSMLSVRLPADELSPRLPAGVVIAAENAPGLCVASGPTDDIARLEAELTAAGITARRLVTSHAFHSAMMDPVIAPLGAAARADPAVAAADPDHVDGDRALAQRRRGHEHALLGRAPAAAGAVRAAAVAQLLAEPRRVLIEIGPRATLSALARQAVGPKRALPPAIPSLADTAEREPEAIAAALGQLWTLGQPIDWAGYRAEERRRRVPLPSYPFQRQRYWVDAPAAGPSLSLAPGAPGPSLAPSPAAPSPAAPSPAAPSPAAPSAVGPGASSLAVAPAFPGAPSSSIVVPVPGVLPAPLPTLEMPVAMSTAVPPAPVAAVDRRPRMLALVCELVEEVSGIDVTEVDPGTPWLELGLDSLTLTQLALQIQRTHAIKVTFRQVMESYPTIASLATLLDERLPPDAAAAGRRGRSPPPRPPHRSRSRCRRCATGAAGEPSSYVRQVIDQQLAVMAQQLAMLGGGGGATRCGGRCRAAAQPQAAAGRAAPGGRDPGAGAAPGEERG